MSARMLCDTHGEQELVREGGLFICAACWDQRFGGRIPPVARFMHHYFRERIDLAAELKRVTLGGFDTVEDYIKYGDAFVDVNFPELESTPMHKIGRVLGRIDRELTRRFKDTEIGRGWRQGYFVGKEENDGT